jgi:hypothetical protein
MGYLSETTRRRIAVVVLVVGALLAVLAISDSGPFSDPPTREEEVQEVVEEFFGAAGEGGFEAFCEMLTRQAENLVRVRGAQLAGGERVSCPEVMEEQATEAFAGAQLRFHDVSVSGNRARVELDLRVPERGPAQPCTVYLIEFNDRWRVNDPGC